MANYVYFSSAIALVLVIGAQCIPVKKCDPSWNTNKSTSTSYLPSRSTNTNTLRLVHILMRHGDRTPEPAEFYPNDPYLNESFYPIGPGQLTLGGQQREYEIGVAVRKRYNDFLGDIWTPEVLDARSTDYYRTKMSLELMLAGLWPPAKSQQWNGNLPWLPIPFNYEKYDEDQLLLPDYSCRVAKEMYEEYLTSDEFLKDNAKYKDVYEYLTEKTGKTMAIPKDVYDLYFALFAEEKLGYALPEWTKCVWPNKITELAVKYYYNMAFSNNMSGLITGPLIWKILEDSQDFINAIPREGFLQREERIKMFIYAAHEFNVAETLIGLKIFYPHVPPYGSYIIMELHEVNGTYGFEVLYQDYEFTEPKLMQIPNCGTFCPLPQFYKIIKENLPKQPC